MYGIGINDATYVTGGCPYYVKWANMLMRCYSKSFQEQHPSYSVNTVCKEWLTFSTFRKWLVENDYADDMSLELDKDLFFFGNTVYEPAKCCLIPKQINSFMSKLKGSGEHLPGVYFCVRDKSFTSQIRDNGKKVRLGTFKDQLSAHLKWWDAKCNVALELSDMITKDNIREEFIAKFSGQSPFVGDICERY